MYCDQLLIDCMSLNIRITKNVIAANFDECIIVLVLVKYMKQKYIYCQCCRYRNIYTMSFKYFIPISRINAVNGRIMI